MGFPQTCSQIYHHQNSKHEKNLKSSMGLSEKFTNI